MSLGGKLSFDGDRQGKPIKQYSLVKINIHDLIEADYKMFVSSSEEYKRGYVINQNDSLLFRQIKRLAQPNFNTSRVDELIFVFAKKDKKTSKQLKHILREGFEYNGRRYVRFGKSASQAKEGITVFVDKTYYADLMRATMLDIEIDKCVISKYEAQRCLVFSSCTVVDEDKLPYIVIVDEYEKIIPHQYVRYVVDDMATFIDDEGKKHPYTTHTVKEGYKDIKISPFDGCGVHSPEFSDIANKYLGLKHKSIGLQIRLPFCKGFSVEFDFKRFYREKGIEFITDVYGNRHRVEDIDCLWNTTMFKAYKLFKHKYGNLGWVNYIKTLEKYDYKMGISKYSHHLDDIKPKARLNFQYLQCLDLWNDKYIKAYKTETKDFYDILDKSNQGKVISLAKYSTDLVERIIKGDTLDSLLLLGIYDNKTHNPTISKYIQACLINHKMFQDIAIKKYLYNKTKLLIKQMKLGKIFVDGFYHIVVGDIVGYLEYAAGLEPVGVLGEREFFSRTLTEGEALSMRSPLMCPSEINKIHLTHTLPHYNSYFEHFKDQDVVMLNMYDISFPQQGGIGSICPL